MKILGIGVDIVENSRISKSLKNNLFIKRYFYKVRDCKLQKK